MVDLAERARRLTLVLTDCDGVLTDGGVFYSAEGEALRRFSVRDGMGVERLRLAGIATAIVSREASATIARRSEKLGLPFLFLGVRDKAAHLSEILLTTSRDLGEVAYLGDDVNDLEILVAVAREGLTGAPADAEPSVLAAAPAIHYRCESRGGHGAFREFADWLLRLRAS